MRRGLSYRALNLILKGGKVDCRRKWGGHLQAQAVGRFSGDTWLEWWEACPKEASLSWTGKGGRGLA